MGNPVNFYSRPPTVDINTLLYISFEGNNGDTNFTDLTGRHTITANGAVQIDISQFAFGLSSGLFDGNRDYLSIPDSTDFTMTSGGDFSLRCFVKLVTLPTEGETNFIMSQVDEPTSNFWLFDIGKSGGNFYLNFQAIAGANQYTGESVIAGGISADTWYSVAFVKNGLFMEYWFDNNLIENRAITNPNCFSDKTAEVRIGVFTTTGATHNDFNGWIDELDWSLIVRTPGGQPVNFYSRADSQPVNFYSLP